MMKKWYFWDWGNGNLSLFDGIKFYVYPVRDDGYLKQNTLSDGISISDSLYAFSTLDGGAIVVAKRSGVVRKTINYQRGLPDDEIYALGTDNNNGLWLSHQFGLTRAELMLPIGNLTMYKGLLGNLISSVWHNNELYVAHQRRYILSVAGKELCQGGSACKERADY